MKRLLTICALLCALCITLQAKPKRNFRELMMVAAADEALDSAQYEAAYRYATLAIEEFPKSCDAYFSRAIACANLDENELALRDINKALKLWKKGCGVDPANLYICRARIWDKMDSVSLAEADYTQAIKLEPRNKVLYARRAYFYEQHDVYDLAEADYQAAYTLDEDNENGYDINVVKCILYQERYNEAEQKLLHILRTDDTNQLAYGYLSYVYQQQERHREALDTYLIYMQLTRDGEDNLKDLVEKDYAYGVSALTKLVDQAVDEDEQVYWLANLAQVEEELEDYTEALKVWQRIEQICLTREGNVGLHRSLQMHLATCYDGVHAHAEAIAAQSKAVDLTRELDDEEHLPSVRASLAYYHKSAAQYDKAIAIYDELLRDDAHSVNFLSGRGIARMYSGDLDGAVADFSAYINTCDSLTADFLSTNEQVTDSMIDALEGVLMGTCKYFLMFRSAVYQKMGQTDLMRHDCERILRMSAAGDTTSVLKYALVRLGRVEEALAMLQLERDDTPVSYWYEAACVYSLAGMKAEAVDALRRAIEAGNTDWIHIGRDFDLDPIRTSPEFKQLIKQYKK